MLTKIQDGEDEDCMVLQNTSILPHHYTVSKYSRPQLEFHCFKGFDY